MTNKFSTLLSFEFEAAVRLKDWACIGQIINECEQYGGGSVYGILADILLSSEAPVEQMASVFHQIVEAIQRQEHGPSTATLSRYLRVVFQLALASSTDIAEAILDLAVSMASDGQRNGSLYPEEELEWLATTTFNRAVDFYLSKEDVASRQWADRAVVVAGLALDKGLERVLLEKYQGLRWES